MQANATVGTSARLWVGEAGGAYNSGAPNVTDGFVSAFWYLDNMALLATTGYKAFCRQTLLGGNCKEAAAAALSPLLQSSQC